MDHSDYIVCSIMEISIGLKRVKLCVYACEISTILPCTGSDVFAYFILILFSFAFLQNTTLYKLAFLLLYMPLLCLAHSKYIVIFS